MTATNTTRRGIRYTTRRGIDDNKCDDDEYDDDEYNDDEYDDDNNQCAMWKISEVRETMITDKMMMMMMIGTHDNGSKWWCNSGGLAFETINTV